ncbi:mfs multidrug transporter [Diplodia corticola]|uniref:Mfs multidrug transporter n=1 Tax=Diplodia corticola TaxID=236234 RepID=A0A1J9QU70_9PEZI|nr:mfs multidrug transporter [Diplodia corticola]OJD31530.1 mfs multidrug transporter [Diplodia corticola]
MQRPRNRQGRPTQQQTADRGRGRGGRGRGGPGRGGRYNSNAPSSVPNTHQVVAGAHVSIVLKVDQPTGRQVQGTVADVLTSGNHPHGIKVRLVDGRVGRVQRMATENEARAGSAGLSNLGRNGEASGGIHQGVTTTTQPPSSRFDMRYRDIREEEEMERPPAGYSLADLLPPDHPLQEQHDVHDEPAAFSSAPQVVCPVCQDFEGDEMAVAHHVNSHFD